MEYIIISSRTPDGLSNRINEYIDKGWKPIDGHKVVEIHRQNRFSGSQHMDTRIEVEYSQTIIKENQKSI